MNSITPAIDANNEALEGLARLDALAKAGDQDAIRLFHDITCGMVARLNEIHLDFAHSVVEWPILLPRDRAQRKAATAAAMLMRIGSVKAGGKGRPEILEYESEKGFALENLGRVSFARAILRTIGYGTEDAVLRVPVNGPGDDEPDDEEAKIAWRAECKKCAAESKNEESDELARTMAAFVGATGIAKYDERLLLRIRDLGEYGKATKTKWVGAILGVLDANPELVPDALAGRATTITSEPRADGSRKRIVNERGGTLGKAIRDGLKNVPAVPGVWGG